MGCDQALGPDRQPMQLLVFALSCREQTWQSKYICADSQPPIPGDPPVADGSVCGKAVTVILLSEMIGLHRSGYWLGHAYHGGAATRCYLQQVRQSLIQALVEVHCRFIDGDGQLGNACLGGPRVRDVCT
jgi:hypothetical protein